MTEPPGFPATARLAAGAHPRVLAARL